MKNLLISSVASHQAKMMNEMMEKNPPHEVSKEPFCLYVRVTGLLYLSKRLKNFFSVFLALIFLFA